MPPSIPQHEPTRLSDRRTDTGPHDDAHMMTLQHLLADADIGDHELRGDPGVLVASVEHDSRRVGHGAMLCCVPGRVTDGHAHAATAVAAGATALVVERWLDSPESVVAVTQVRVPSVRTVMGRLASAVHGHPSRSLRVLGVTGTNGKTTTTYLLESIVRAAGGRPGVIGTVETRIDGRSEPGGHTTPEAPELQALLARMRDAGCDTVAMEVSSHALDMGRVEGTHFAAACFTNLSPEHLDYHATMDRYFRAKADLFRADRVRVAAINVADPYGRRLATEVAQAGIAVRRWSPERPGGEGASPGPGSERETDDVFADRVRIDLDGVELELHAPELAGARTVHLNLLGRYNVANAVAAAATALAAGFEADAVVAGLEAATVVPGRLERVSPGAGAHRRGPLVVVDYAHTPDALRNVLVAAGELATAAGRGPGALASGRVVLVFGCGGDRDRGKRPMMGECAAELADELVVTTDNSRSEPPQAIVDEILAGIESVSGLRRRATRVAVELDRRRAIRSAVEGAGAGDVVVIAGKGHELGQTAAGVTVPFDDRVEARLALGVGSCA